MENQKKAIKKAQEDMRSDIEKEKQKIKEDIGKLADIDGIGGIPLKAWEEAGSR